LATLIGKFEIMPDFLSLLNLTKLIDWRLKRDNWGCFNAIVLGLTDLPHTSKRKDHNDHMAAETGVFGLKTVHDLKVN
jgi:hypothetical protein